MASRGKQSGRTGPAAATPQRERGSGEADGRIGWLAREVVIFFALPAPWAQRPTTVLRNGALGRMAVEEEARRERRLVAIARAAAVKEAGSSLGLACNLTVYMRGIIRPPIISLFF